MERSTTEPGTLHPNRYVPLTARALVSDYLATDANWDGTPGSPLTRERENAEQRLGTTFRDEIQAAVNHASLFLFATVQHVESIAALLDVPRVYSLTAVSRAAMEVGASAWRLTDPTIGARERVARLSLDRLHSAREYEKLLREAGLSREELASFPSLTEIVTNIESLGFKVELGERGSWGDRIDEFTRPSITTTMESFAGREIESDSKRVYRLASAVTHGTLWGLTIFFSPLDTAGGHLSSEFVVDQGWIDDVSLVAAESYAWALENFVLLLGWDAQPLRRWMMAIDALFG